MSERSAPIPQDIAALVDKAATQGLTAQERMAINGWLMSERGRIDPMTAEALDSLVRTAPDRDPTGLVTPDTPRVNTEGAASRVATSMAEGAGLASPAVSTVPDVAATWAAQAEVLSPGRNPATRSLTSELIGGIDRQGNPIVAPIPGGMQFGGLAAPDAVSSIDMGTGERRGNRLNTETMPGHRRENWRSQPEALLEPLPTDSAFSGILPENLGMFTASPALAARRIAESRGGGELTAAGLAPYAQSALTLAQMGVLGGDTGLRDLSSGPASNAAALGAAEDWLGQMGMGASGDPTAIYREVFRRARRTDPSLMDTGQGEAGDVYNQIDVTNGALMSAAPFMTGTAREGLASRLHAAASDYLMAYASGETTMSYPDYLKSIGAKRWLGRAA